MVASAAKDAIRPRVQQKLAEDSSRYEKRGGSKIANNLILNVAVGYSEGNCFLCPNGHPYFVGDHEDAKQIATCPDCGTSLFENDKQE